ncbi:MAG: hypothetical protein LC808_27125 [Actinobacteria bacterium]|nr:hypothetical protein [Actinomycetota bacterium]
MTRRRIFGITAAIVTVAAIPAITSAAPASADGATTIQCEDTPNAYITPYFLYRPNHEGSGVVVLGPQGQFLANCTVALLSRYQSGEIISGQAQEYGGRVFDCSEALPGIPPEYTYGVTVVTPSGNGFIRCVVHITPDGGHSTHPGSG